MQSANNYGGNKFNFIIITFNGETRMKANKTAIQAALALIFGALSVASHAAVLNNGDVLHITSGVPAYGGGVLSGSYYGVDFNGDDAIDTVEKTLLSEGTTGLVIGAITSPGATHSGPPTAGDTNEITAPDYFFGSTGSWYSTIPITGSTTAGLNMSGWNWPWNGIPGIPLGSGAWQPTNCAALGCTGYTFTDGIGRLQWDGVYGHGYLLDFASAVPDGDPSGFGGVRFYTHLEGVVACYTTPEGGCVQAASTVPLPAAAWLFGSGVFGLLGAMMRRKQRLN